MKAAEVNECRPEPVLRWAGSKRQILSHLATRYPVDASKYIEPFCGSASLFLRLKPSQAVLADTNKSLIECYRAIRRAPRKVYEQIQSYEVSPESYYRIREIEPGTQTSIEKAATFIFLNRYCFNGLYRTNRLGRFNVPFGALKAGRLPTMDNFVRFGRALRNVTLQSTDFQETLRHASPGSFVYLDPPYAVSKKRVFKEYGSLGFSYDDLQRLKSAIKVLDGNGVTFVLSYAESEESNYLAEGFNSEIIQVKRLISANVESRQLAREHIIYNVG